MTKVYLVRHGEAVGNVTHVFQGLSDLPLTENGKRQAALVGERMKEIHLDKVCQPDVPRPGYGKGHCLPTRACCIDGAWSCRDQRRRVGRPVLAGYAEKYPHEVYLWDHHIYQLCIPGGRLSSMCVKGYGILSKISPGERGKDHLRCLPRGAIRCLMQSCNAFEA